jgi:Fic-DOC domain mobile mystery protein B
MGLDLEYIDGQTPLDENEIHGLKIPSITTKGELDEMEQNNIEEAQLWLLGRKLNYQQILTPEFILSLHKRMYVNVWNWAGEFRKTNKNLGIPFFQIPTELKQLLEDTKFWIENNTYDPDEIAIRFKHRLVSIHCFSNGNGRHSRMMADILIEKVLKKEMFSWGMSNLSKENDIRANYLKAIKLADQHDYSELMNFARS